ncbi:kinesin light chain-like [Montipora capricornis]|uniref:kinesin light chain-like n=1 Tax=Montipora capricornis TaxID=246305 RepID=UPI0035F1282D
MSILGYVKGLKPRKTLWRDRGSDFELTDKDEDDEDEDEVSLAKIKQLENAFKLQQERIASLEKEAEMLPELLFQMESLQTAIEKGKVDVDEAEEIKRMNVLTAKRNLTSFRDIRKEKLRYRPRGKAFHLTAGVASDIKRGSQHFDVADDCIKLAAVYREIGDVDKAQRYKTLAFDIRDKRLGSQHPDVAAVYDELAAVYRNRGDLDGAKFYLKLALDSKGKKLGFQHPDVAAVYVELAAVYRKRGDLDRAKGYVMLALDIREKKLGSQHPDVAAAYDELAAVYRTRGDLDEAKWYLRRARDIRGEKIWAPVSTAMS